MKTPEVLESQPHVGYDLDRTALHLQSYVAAPKLILDVGCGFGRLTCKAAEMFPRSMVYGVDADLEVLRLAQLRADRIRPAPSVTFIAAELPSGLNRHPRVFDLVIFSAVWEILETAERMGRFASRMLRPGGYFYVDHAFIARTESERDDQHCTIASALQIYGDILHFEQQSDIMFRDSLIASMATRMAQSAETARRTGLQLADVENRFKQQCAAYASLPHSSILASGMWIVKTT